jgi:hypothetical protein
MPFVNELSSMLYQIQLTQTWFFISLQFSDTQIIDIAMSEFIYEKYNNINAMHIPEMGLKKICKNSWGIVTGLPTSLYQQDRAAIIEQSDVLDKHLHTTT